MNYIKGKLKSLIFTGANGYHVGLFRVKATNDEELADFLNKTITFTGYFGDLNQEDSYFFYGRFVHNEKYGYQYQVTSYERVAIKGEEAIIEFLSSSLIKGCGEKTAAKIVELWHEAALDKIKENYQNLLLISNMSEVKALKIYQAVLKYENTDQNISQLKVLGFTMSEALNIINQFGTEIDEIIKQNIYLLTKIIDFNKIDRIFLANNQATSPLRLAACLIEGLRRAGNATGNTYFLIEQIIKHLKAEFNLALTLEQVTETINNLISKQEIVMRGEKIYLAEIDKYESTIAHQLNKINSLKDQRIKNFTQNIRTFEDHHQIIYNQDQKQAIKAALEKRITIITGGPGTGKTTIIKAIVNLYIDAYQLNGAGIINEIALLSPTGRASKKLMEATNLPAMTIHRYLKWNKETNEFQVNEFNKNPQRLIIVDEVSMIDTYLFYALLQGLNYDLKLVLVGDVNQLPSVGPGLVLADLIATDKYQFCPLTQIYRQSANSYIPLLAKEIREQNLSPDFQTQKDDYNFLLVKNDNIRTQLKNICQISVKKGLTEKDLQVLAPMYKGQNGIDNLNVILQTIFNPAQTTKKEIMIGEVCYRVGDKVLQLVNDLDNNVFNGDIGFICNISTKNSTQKKDLITIDFEGNKIVYEREDMNQIKHAYVISIHKSQGSEFAHVLIPLCLAYNKMLYNKLIYTAVSRAKKSLVIIGEVQALINAINNNFSNERQTTLKDRINND